VNKAIKKLVEVEIEGEPLLRRDIVGKVRKKSIYSVTKEAGELEGKMSTKRVIEIFFVKLLRKNITLPIMSCGKEICT